MARIVHVLVLEGQWRRQQMPLDLWQRHWSSRLGSGFSYGNAPHSSWRLDCISVRCMAYGVSFVAIFSLNPKVPRYLGERGRTSDDFLICEGAEQLATNDFTINRIGISTSSMSLNARLFSCKFSANMVTTLLQLQVSPSLRHIDSNFLEKVVLAIKHAESACIPRFSQKSAAKAPVPFPLQVQGTTSRALLHQCP
jgi:hypothetical protein